MLTNWVLWLQGKIAFLLVTLVKYTIKIFGYIYRMQSYAQFKCIMFQNIICKSFIWNSKCIFPSNVIYLKPKDLYDLRKNQSIKNVIYLIQRFCLSHICYYNPWCNLSEGAYQTCRCAQLLLICVTQVFTEASSVSKYKWVHLFSTRILYASPAAKCQVPFKVLLMQW